MSRLQPLWLHLGPIARRLAASRTLLVASDFDGTLAPIAPHPGRARLPARTRRVLMRLRGLPQVRLAIISGRARADLARQVRVPGVWLAGSSGFEIPGQRPPRDRVPEPLVASLHDWCAQFPGAWLEDKGAVFTAHFRGVSAPLHAPFRAGVRRRVRRHARAARLVAGLQAFEILPAAHRDKSDALDHWLPRRRAHAGLFFFGDDTNDEPLHRHVRKLGGIAIAIGRQRSHAQYRVHGPEDVQWFLEWLAREWSALRQARLR